MLMPDKVLVCTSGYGLKRGPFITLSFEGKDVCQISVEEARHFAMAVLQAAEAAESDGIFFAMATERRLGVKGAAELLLKARKIRDEQRRAREGVN